MPRHWALALVAAVLVGLACENPDGRPTPSPTAPPSPVKGYPSSMVALGDSITSGYGSCLAPTSCPRNSWATGDGLQVYSHYRRILAANPAMRGHARNLAKPGATIRELPAQAARAVATPADYVTILVGANDACDGPMTTVSAFRAEVDQTLETIKTGLPQARLLLVSIPDVYRVWVVGHESRVVVGVWRSGVCPNLLANATSTAEDDVARRQAFRDRIAAYNEQLQQACAAYGSRCRFDNVATFKFDLTMLSAIDFFHPNAAGQEALARETYPGSFTWGGQ